MLRRSLATTFATVLALATPLLAAATPATASDPSAANTGGPVITSPTAGAQVGGEIAVTVASTAPYVLIAWEPEAEMEDWLYPSDTVDGTARARLSTSGHAGPTTIVARECATSHVCEGPATSVRVDVANAPVTFDDSGWLEEAHDDFTVRAEPDGAWAWYGFFFDGRFIPPVIDIPWFPVDVGLMDLADGTHTVQIARCTRLSHEAIIEPPVCDMANATEVRSFVVRTALHPTITDIRLRRFSPDGDGVKDVASLRATAESPQLVTWALARGAEVVAQGSAGEQQPGPYTFPVRGLEADGKPLPDGRYELRVAAFSLPADDPGIDDRIIHGSTSTMLRIDTVAPRVTDDAVSPRVLRPRGDGFKDTVTMAGRLTERAARMRVQLRRDGAVRRTLRLGREPSGEFTVRWDGRRRNGRVLPRGVYRYRFVVTDRAGNEATRRGGWLRLRRP